MFSNTHFCKAQNTVEKKQIRRKNQCLYTRYGRALGLLPSSSRPKFVNVTVMVMNHYHQNIITADVVDSIPLQSIYKNATYVSEIYPRLLSHSFVAVLFFSAQVITGVCAVFSLICAEAQNCREKRQV